MAGDVLLCHREAPGLPCRPTDHRSDDTARGNQPRSMYLSALWATHNRHRDDYEKP